MSSYIVALTMDWQGTKAAVFGSDLKQTAMAFEESSVLSPEPGQAIQEPEDLVSSAKRVIRRALEDAGISAQDVAAVGLSGEMGGFLGVDKDGRAMTAYVTPQDTRSAKYVDLMRAKDGREIIKLSGGPAGTQGAQVLWWKQEEEHTYFDIAKFVTGYAYVGMQMCGLNADQAFYDYTGFAESGFGDAVYKCWSPDILHAFHLSEDKFPKVVAPTDVIGEVTAEFAQESGLAAGTKVVAGCVTAAAGLLGAGITKPGCLGQFTGSLSLVAGVTKEHKPDEQNGAVLMMRVPVGDSWYAMASTSGSGLAERWFKDTLTGEVEAGYAELDAEAAGVAPGAGGVFFVPHFQSHDAAKGAFVGLDWHATRAFLYRAVIEGIAYQKRLIIDDMRALHADIDYSAIAAIDAAERGALANQVEADVLGMTVTPMQAQDPVAAGCAAVAAQGAGLAADAAAMVPAPASGTPSQPDAAAQTAYDGCVRAYRDLVVLLGGFNPKRG